MATITNDIAQIMTLIDWKKVNESLKTVNRCPNLSHRIELFRYVHTKPGASIRKTQMLSSGRTVSDVTLKENMSDFMRTIFSAYSGRTTTYSIRVSDEICAFILTICQSD
jgi:hypothetical protein